MKPWIKYVAVIGLITTVIVPVMSCDDKSDAFTSGTYHYVGYDTEGQKVAEGDIIITVDDSLIEGQKDIELIINAQDVQDTGTGLIQGHIKNDGTVEIYLMNSPGPYLVIRGSFDHGILRGKRYYCLELLETVIGTFVAEKVR